MSELTYLPKHVAIIMDGNGRWALGQGMRRPKGHREGSESVRTIVRACRRKGVRALTLFAFSEQNWARPTEEVTALMALLRDFLISERSELLDNDIRLRAIGRVEKLPASVLDILRPLEADTAHCDKMTLTLALSYGGREEIIDAAKEIATRASDGLLDPSELTDDAFESFLPSMDVGPVDLLIRTGGELRISNFLLWAASYAELFFSDKLWPDFDESDLDAALEAYQTRERRFGLISKQKLKGAFAS